MLGGDCALVHIALSVKLPLHGPPAVREGVSAGADILGHVHGGALEVVPHNIGQFLYANFLAGVHKEREVPFQIIAHHVIQITVGVLCDGVAFLIVEGEPAVRKDIEGAPGAGVAAADGAEIGRTICLLEGELGI